MLLILLVLFPLGSKIPAMSSVTTSPKMESSKPPQSQVLVARLAEIKAMDKSDCNFSEKRALRKERRSIKKHFAGDGGSIYISVGALLIVIVLLILLL
jgi:hypothetical protein